MATLREYLSTGSLWTEIKNIESFPFIINPEDLDFQNKIQFGDRTLFEPYSEIELKDIAPIIVNTFSEKWNKHVSLDTDSINMFGCDETQNTKTSTGSTTDTGSGNSTNKVSVYNEDTLINDSGTDNTSTNTKDVDLTDTEKNAKISYENAFKNLNDLEKLNIINSVLKDVSIYLTLQLY